MSTPELTNYIAQAKAAGITEPQIKDELIKAGWQQADINEAFGGTATPIADSPISNKMPIFKIGAISALAILLIAGSAGAFWYADKKLNWGIVSPIKVAENIISSQTPKPSQESSLQTLSQESSSTSPNPSATTNTQTSPTATPKIGTKDCGAYNGTHFAISPPLTNQDKTALNCFNEAAANCTPSIIKSEDGIYGSYTYKILNKDDNDCNISFKLITPPTAPNVLPINYFSTCILPMDSFITPMLQEMKKQTDDSSSMGFMFSIGFMFTKGPDDKIGNDGWYHPSGAKNTTTGEPIIFKCK